MSWGAADSCGSCFPYPSCSFLCQVILGLVMVTGVAACVCLVASPVVVQLGGMTRTLSFLQA